MHKIKKYNVGGGFTNSYPFQWTPPSTLFTIQNSSNFLNTTIPKTPSTDWMKNITNKAQTLTTSSPVEKGINSLTNYSGLPSIGKIRGVSDLGKIIGSGFDKVTGSIANSLDISKGSATGLLGSMASNVIDQFLPQPDIQSGVDVGLDVLAKNSWNLAAFGPIGGAVAVGTNLLNFANKGFGKNLNSDGTADMNNVGYGNLSATDLLKGTKGKRYTAFQRFFNKGKVRKQNDRINEGKQTNLLASLNSYQGLNDLNIAKTTSSALWNKNRTDMFGNLNTNMIAAKQGGKISKRELKEIVRKAQKGAKLEKIESVVNVIPEGAFHSRKNNLPEDIAKQVTPKGIPVVSEEDGGKLKQHAEVEKNEIIFHKKTTEIIEDLRDKYNEAKTQKEKDELAIECGKFIAKEILVNTEDKTGLIDTI